jgi:hypothetical protein
MRLASKAFLAWIATENVQMHRDGLATAHNGTEVEETENRGELARFAANARAQFPGR